MLPEHIPHVVLQTSPAASFDAFFCNNKTSSLKNSKKGFWKCYPRIQMQISNIDIPFNPHRKEKTKKKI